MRRIKVAKKITPPDFIGGKFDCDVCGGKFKVTKRTHVDRLMIGVSNETKVVVTCPYCGETVRLDCDPHAGLRARVNTYIESKVPVVNSIEDEGVRVQVQKLVQSIYEVLNED